MKQFKVWVQVTVESYDDKTEEYKDVAQSEPIELTGLTDAAEAREVFTDFANQHDNFATVEVDKKWVVRTSPVVRRKA